MSTATLNQRLWHQRVPSAGQRTLNAANRGNEDIELSGFDLLHRANIQIDALREFFLCHFSKHPFTTNVGAETGKFCGALAAIRHAPLGRKIIMDRTAQWGVKFRREFWQTKPRELKTFLRVIVCLPIIVWLMESGIDALTKQFEEGVQPLLALRVVARLLLAMFVFKIAAGKHASEFSGVEREVDPARRARAKRMDRLAFVAIIVLMIGGYLCLVFPSPSGLFPYIAAKFAPSPDPLPLPFAPQSVASPSPASDVQRRAVQLYPELGIAGSPFNRAFVGRYREYQQKRPDFFRDPEWPTILAREIAESHPSTTGLQPKQ